MKFSRSMIVGSVAVAVAISLIGCSPTPENSDDPESPAELIPLTIGIAGIPPVFLETVAYVAEKNGYYKELGLDVELRPFGTSVDVGRAVTSGEIPVGYLGTGTALTMVASGSPAVAVLGFEASSYLIGSADDSVSTCSDLKGKTIAVDAAGAPKALALTTMLASCGLDDGDVSAVPVGGTQSADAMIAKQVDIAVMHPDELAVVLEQRPTDVVIRVTDADPESHFFSLIANSTAIEKDRDAIVAVVAATRMAIDFALDPSNSDAVAAIASEVTGRSASVAKTALAGYIDIGYWPASGDGLPQNRIDRAIAQQVNAGNIAAGSAPTFADYVDASVYKDAVALLG